MNLLWRKTETYKHKAALLILLTGLSLIGLTGCDSAGSQQQGLIDQNLQQSVDNGVFKISGNLLTTELKSEGLTLNLEWCEDGLIRTEYLQKDQKSEDTLVIGNDSWELMPFQYDIAGEIAILKSKEMTVTVDLKQRLIQYAKADGVVFATEMMGEKVQEGQFKMALGKQDSFYGLHGYDAWENSKEGLLRNSGGVVKAGQQGNCGGPLIWTTAGYGIVFDSASGRMNLKAGDMTYTHNTAGGKEYYVMVGNPMTLMKILADLTGQSPMSPKWALGFHHSEWGIDEAEMKETVAAYRVKGLPLDNYILDFDWKAWGEDNYGEFRWNEAKFPSGKSGKLAEDMSALGVKMSGIMKPRIHVKTVQGQYAEDHDFWWPKRPVAQDYFSKKPVNGLDFAKEDVRKWYFEHNQLMLDTGFAGYWNDEADEGYDAFQHMNMQRAMYEGQRAQTDRRVWSINRNFYLGAQRYSYGLWSGDIDSGFDSMKSQRERMLSAINLGEMKWGMDTGGFNGPEPSPENYARWMQMNAFAPIFRVHGREFKQRQPWAFGKQAEAVSKAAMELRYSLIPYIYAYERETYDTGVGLVRPLMMAYPNDQQAANYVDGWLFGEWLYVAPVVDEGQTKKDIYLPAGDWIDYNTGKTYKGGSVIQYAVDSKTWQDIPLFIKSGAIIPKQPAMNFVGEKPVERLTLEIFPSEKETAFTVYDDDGNTYQYEKAQYFKQTVSVSKSGSRMTFKTSAPTGDYKSESKFYTVKLHGIAAKKVSVNGVAVTAQNGPKALEKLNGGFASSQDIYGPVTTVVLPVGETLELVAE